MTLTKRLTLFPDGYVTIWMLHQIFMYTDKAMAKITIPTIHPLFPIPSPLLLDERTDHKMMSILASKIDNKFPPYIIYPLKPDKKKGQL